MKLKEIKKILPVEIIRECNFESLGTINHRMDKMLVFLDDRKYLDKLTNNDAVCCVITKKELLIELPDQYGTAISENPRKTFYEFHNYLSKHTNFYLSDFPSEISSNAMIHPTAYISPKNVRIEDGVIIEPGVVIRGYSVIRENVTLRAGCTIGSQGFEFKRTGDNIISVHHAGGVLLHRGVEIQSNSNVDRSVFGGFTEIGEDTKLDTLVHFGHNSKTGTRCLIAALTVVAGSATLGDDVWIGPGSTICSGIEIGDNAEIKLGSVVTKDVNPGQKVSGNFAVEHKKFLDFIKKIS